MEMPTSQGFMGIPWRNLAQSITRSNNRCLTTLALISKLLVQTTKTNDTLPHSRHSQRICIVRYCHCAGTWFAIRGRRKATGKGCHLPGAVMMSHLQEKSSPAFLWELQGPMRALKRKLREAEKLWGAGSEIQASWKKQIHTKENWVLDLQEWSLMLRELQIQSQAWDVFSVNQVNSKPSSFPASGTLRAS